jgi:hypothetical protein
LVCAFFAQTNKKAEGFPNSSAPFNLKPNNYEKQKVFTMHPLGLFVSMGGNQPPMP